MAGITLTNLANYNMGVPADEVGINVQKVSVKVSAQKIEVKDRVGRVIGVATHDLKQEYSIEGFIAGTTGLMAGVIGTIITIASITILGGIASTGACILEEINADYETGAHNKVTFKLSRYNDIPSTASQVVI